MYSCWLTTRDGTIFGFVAPMLAVVVVSANYNELNFVIYTQY